MTATAELRSHAGIEDDDATLLARLRGGGVEPYAELWRRHLASAYRVAHRYRGRASAEDIVGEASLRVFDRIRAGDGPTSNFRGYFLTVVKNVALDLGKADLRLVPADAEELETCSVPMEPYDAAARVDQDLVRVAFGRLSARDQQVLWQTAVQGAPAAVVAVGMGLSPNAVSAAAVRARDALRAAYLDAHADRAVARTRSKECRWVLSQLGRYVRGKLHGKQRTRVERHLQNCRHAQLLAAELTEINVDLPALMVPLVFVAAAHGAAAWCSAAVTAGQHGSAPQSLPVDAASAALAGGGASGTALISKVAAVVTAAALGAGLSGPGSIVGSSSQPAQAHRSSSGNDMARLLTPAEHGGDGMPDSVIRSGGTALPQASGGQTSTGTGDAAAATVGDQPKATEASDQAAARAGVTGQAAIASGDSLLPAPGGTEDSGTLTSAAPSGPAPSTTGSTTGTTASTTTAGTPSVTTTAKPKKPSPTPPSTIEPSTGPATPTSTSSPTSVPLPPGQAKKTDANAAPSAAACKNAWSQAPACRTNTP